MRNVIDPVRFGPLLLAAVFVLAGLITPLVSQETPQEEYESITSADCMTCHEESERGTDFNDDLSHSVHEGFECLDCH